MSRATLHERVAALLFPRPVTLAGARALLQRHRTPDLLLAAARHTGHPEPVLAVFRQAATQRWLAHQRLLSTLDAVSASIVDAGIDPPVVLKGPALQRLYGADSTRAYNDLDLMVDRRDFADALRAIEKVGSIEDRNWALLVRDGLSQVHCSAFGVPIDLHWHVLNEEHVRASFAVDADGLLARAAVAPELGPALRVLDPVDAFLHVALHGVLSGGDRLLWHVDLHHSAAVIEDWDETVRRAHRARVGLPVQVMVEKVRQSIGISTPQNISRSLSGQIGAGLTRLLRSWQPHGRLPGGGSLNRASARALRGRPGATAQALARQGLAMVGRFRDPHEFWTDPSDPRHPMHAAGSRAAYLDYVTGSSRTSVVT